MINPELMELLEKNDILDILTDSVAYQLQKINNVEKTNEGRDWYQELPQIVKEKFDNYKKDYENLARILALEHEQVHNEMNKGYYYWRLLRSACTTYRNDLVEYDQQLILEFNLPETEAISDNSVLNECIGVLDKHAIEK
ncbi:MAG: hypothetical protein OEW78_06560 [Nitrosopumilus sp.]|uniref:hypothetical protein n=1 Tax=Nitrosopumilus sp. TaxID=2024843 RepID=UPI00246AEC7D|nr:hypothetical protein [Nitrosopumilus sp.]MDH5431527.1 hypothetical protein [Nitrosopumilus sp.]MDH5666108.1 hypothetical protein [Nitrosopumilus sp.]MDH5697246.1 hypothetical protein [Nitrosopumilus sp.]